MSTLKRSFLYTMRKKTKTLILFLVIYALRDLFIRFFGKEVEALRAFFIEGGRANAENQNHPIVRKIEP